MWGKRNCLSFETAVGGIEPPSPQLTVRRSTARPPLPINRVTESCTCICIFYLLLNFVVLDCYCEYSGIPIKQWQLCSSGFYKIRNCFVLARCQFAYKFKYSLRSMESNIMLWFVPMPRDAGKQSPNRSVITCPASPV